MGNSPSPPPPDNSHLVAQANAEAEKARANAERLARQAEAAAKAAVAEADERARKHAADCAERAAKAKAEADERMQTAAIQQERVKLQHQQAIEKSKREAEREEIAFKERQAREAQAAAERRQQAEIAHKKKMKELENANKENKREGIQTSINAMDIKAATTDNQLIAMNKELAEAEAKKALYIAEKDKLMEDINNFDTYKAAKLDEWSIQNGLDIAFQNYERDRKEIEDAIAKTGVHSDEVGNFLMLTHAMTGATMSTQAQANKLDVALSTFGTIINNECQDQITIDYYFNARNLQDFSPLLAKDGFITLQHLECDDIKQCEKDILTKLDRGIQRKEKQQTETAEKDIVKYEKLESEMKSKLEEISAALDKLGDFDETKEPEKENEKQTLLSEHSEIDSKRKMYESLLQKQKDILQDLKEKAKKREDDKKEREKEEKTEDVGNDDDEKVVDVDLEGDDLCKYLLKQWKLSEFWEKLEDEGWDDAADWVTLTAEDLENDIGIEKKGKRNKFMRKSKEWKEMRDKKKKAKEKAEEEEEKQKQLEKNKPKLKVFDYLTTIQQRELKRICLNSETWKPYEKQKTKLIKRDLLELCPVLGDFFGRVDTAIKQTSELLNYKEELSDAQRKAIQMKDTNHNKLKAIELKKKDFDGRRLLVKNSQCEIYSSSSKQWCTGKVIDLKKDEEGEWLTVEYCAKDERSTKEVQRYNKELRPLPTETLLENKEDIHDEKRNLPVIKKGAASDIVIQSDALITASIVNINVTDTLMSQFTKSPVTERGLTLATGVEDCCVHIIRNQGEIRQSVFLAQEILKYKPANMNDQRTVKLWKAVDAGIIRIFQSALEMVKVAATYFSYFIRFQNSFKFFVSCYKDDEDTALLVSLERVKKDVREFNKFRENFANTVIELNKTAMECIGNCVKQQIGHKNWEKSRSSIERTEKIYLAKKKLYDQESLKYDNELDDIERKKVLEISKEAKATEQCKILTARIEQGNAYLAQCQAQIKDLQKLKAAV